MTASMIHFPKANPHMWGSNQQPFTYKLLTLSPLLNHISLNKFKIISEMSFTVSEIQHLEVFVTLDYWVLYLLCFYPSVFSSLKWEESQFNIKVKIQNRSNFSWLNLPLVFVHMLTVTAVIESAANPTETIMNLKDTKSEKSESKLLIIHMTSLQFSV